LANGLTALSTAWRAYWYFDNVILRLFICVKLFFVLYHFANVCKKIVLKSCLLSLSLSSFIAVKIHTFSNILKAQNDRIRMREYSNSSSARHLVRILSRIEYDSIRVRIIDIFRRFDWSPDNRYTSVIRLSPSRWTFRCLDLCG